MSSSPAVPILDLLALSPLRTASATLSGRLEGASSKAAGTSTSTHLPPPTAPSTTTALLAFPFQPLLPSRLRLRPAQSPPRESAIPSGGPGSVPRPRASTTTTSRRPASPRCWGLWHAVRLRQTHVAVSTPEAEEAARPSDRQAGPSPGLLRKGGAVPLPMASATTYGRTAIALPVCRTASTGTCHLPLLASTRS